MINKYVGLHVHSERSFLDGQAPVAANVARAAELGHSAIALTDHQEVNGHIELQRQCNEHEIKPIFGMEGYLHPEAGEGGGKTKGGKSWKVTDISHITVLAQNQTGLSNLWRWSTQAYRDGAYHRATTRWEWMKELSEGLWASDGCLLSYMAKAIIDDDTDRQHELMGRYLDTFGDHFYMELHTFQHLDPQGEDDYVRNAQMAMVNQAKVDLAEQYGVPLVVVNDSHYAQRQDWVKHQLVWEIGTGKSGDDQTGRGETAAWIMSDDELVYYMSKHGVSEVITRQAIDNTAMIADSCDAEIVPRSRMPKLNDTPDADVEMMTRLIEDGIKRKVIDAGLDEARYRDRVETEMRVIVDGGFSGYFNVVADLTQHARYNMKRLLGPGRGSAGGSLCAYLMDITHMDPLKYGLLFERFMAEGRNDLPDIDIDIPKSALRGVKAYTGDTYGHDHVCGIGTLSRSAPKATVKDVARAMKVPIPDSLAIGRAMGATKPDDTWDTVMERRSAQLEPWVSRYPELFEMAGQMCGMVRQSGGHASGWIIAPEPIDGNLPMRTPLKEETDSFTGEKYRRTVSSFEQNEIEWMGYVKFDLLGIRHLDTIERTIELVRERHGIDIDPYHFGDAEFRDPDIWTAVGRGDCLGIFQLEADLMAGTAARLKPKSELDVSELVAIDRPGVIDAGLVTPYIERSHGRQAITYDHPLMEEIVGDTYGIMIYQEQMMRMSRVIAGFTASESDWLRKVVGKKKLDALPALREQFYAGARANDSFLRTCTMDPEATIDKLWASIEASGKYLFNKSHSVAYAILASWEVWLRHYYYPEFITASLQTDDGEDTHPAYVRHARKNGIEVLPPDINSSGSIYTLTDDGIRYGLSSVKQVGDAATREIERARRDGPFASLDDFNDRVKGQTVNIGVLVNLIRIGAFDSLDPDRVALERRAYELRKTKPDKWRYPLPTFSDHLESYRLEKELVGSHILYDPLHGYAEMIADLCIREPEEIEENYIAGSVLKVGGLVTNLKVIQTKKKDSMAFMTLSFEGRDYELIVFPSAWATARHLLEIDAPVICSAIRLEDGKAHVSAVQRLDFL